MLICRNCRRVNSTGGWRWPTGKEIVWIWCHPLRMEQGLCHDCRAKTNGCPFCGKVNCRVGKEVIHEVREKK